MMEFKNKAVIVTGGTGGIGSVVVDHFLREGASVLVLGLKKPAKWKDQAHCIFMKADVSRERDAVKAAAYAKKKFRGVHVLVNCAGIQAPIGAFADVSMAAWKKNLEVNLLGTANMIHAVLPYMKKQHGGSIINFSGGGATGSRPHFSAYAAAKTAVVRLTEIVADETREQGIRVNAIAPGAVNTAMLEEVLRVGKKAGAKELKEASERKMKGGTPPERAAELVLFLASKQAVKITGKLLSAVWDPWKDWKADDITKLQESDIFTLRRKV